ncbi:hypothetical protein TWF970_000742 [Orbilia oligospora]|uniref:Uncharacterized protein n=1 Tax=Orbilia oligospora TaxID=2813651 RepID=A0A7C8RIL3_ORBOL|nr:hypothetical protein TWF970_000742 [Orbilia oligospora]
MSWSRVNTLDPFATAIPGFILLSFEISKVSGGKPLARDNVNFVVTWEHHPDITNETPINPNIGIDPPPVHLSFIPGTAKTSLGAMIGIAEPTKLDFIASWMIRGILYGNEKLIEFAVPGGSVIVKVVQLAETIDTAADVVLAIADLRDALARRDAKAAVKALVKAVKGLRELAKTVVGGVGDV